MTNPKTTLADKQRIRDLALANGFKLKDQGDGVMDLNPYVYDFAAALLRDNAGVVPEPVNYTPSTWHEVKTREELEAFFLSRLPAIRKTAHRHGYAIGLHGTLRRDMDLIAVPWRDDASGKELLAHAISMAATGMTRDGAYQWEQKPLGRVATSIPCCWTPWPEVAGSGHIDLSVMAAAPSAPVLAEPGEIQRLREALVYVAFALHSTPQHMLAEGITLIDGDTVQVRRNGWVVQASTSPRRQPIAQQPVQGGGDAVTEAMVDAYLRANDAYWRRTDQLPTPPDKWRTGTPREATRESLRAALALPPAQPGDTP